MHVCYLLSWFRGVVQIWPDEILPSVGKLRGGKAAREFASFLRSKQHFDFGGLLLLN